MVDLSARGRFRFKTRADRDEVLRLTLDAIRIQHDEPALVIGSGFEIEEASRKSIGHDVLERVLVDALVPDAQQRQAVCPGRLALLPIGHGDRGIAIVIAVDMPFESQ